MNRRAMLAVLPAAALVGVALTPAARAAGSLRSEIQAAIDGAAAAGGGLVDLGAGQLDIDIPLVTKTGITIAGRGIGTTRLRLIDNAGSAIRSSRVIESSWANASGPAGEAPKGSWDDRVAIYDLTVDGNRGAQSSSPVPSVAAMNNDLTAAIVLDHVRQPQIENVEVINAKYRGLMIVNSTQGSDDRPSVKNVRAIGTGYTGIALINVWSAIVATCRAESCTRAGIYLEATRYSSVAQSIARNTLTTPGDGAGDGYGFVVDLVGGDGFVSVSGSIASVCRSDGFLISSDGTPYSYVLVDGNISTGNGAAGFHTWKAPSVVFGTNISRWNVQDATVVTP